MITIIVMLILVAVSISTSINGGLFNYAGKAVGDTKNAIENEKGLTSTDIIDYYVNKQQEVTNLKPAVTSLKAYSEELLNEDGVLEENTKYESGYYMAVIPKGFYLSEVAAEQTIAGGLVIKDATGNEFVWIPVKDGEFERTNWYANEPIDNETTIDEILQNKDEEDLKQEIALDMGYNSMDGLLDAFGLETYEDLLTLAEQETGKNVENTIDLYEAFFPWPGALSEEYTENGEVDPTGEFENMVSSVNKYGGFYIGRYEAGSEENRLETRTKETVLVKKGEYPYNYVMWGLEMDEYEEEETNYGHGAVYLCRDMYKEDEGEEETYGVTSTLCYGVQWDATLRFIKDKVNVTNSTSWGNYTDSDFTFTGEYSADYGTSWDDDETEKSENESWLLTTGASEKNKAKNIYDLAGNVYEWTMEANSSGSRVYRGGDYCRYGSYDPASRRSYSNPDSCYNDHIGFRPSLYIK